MNYVVRSRVEVATVDKNRRECNRVNIPLIMFSVREALVLISRELATEPPCASHS
jgi:hypothetical protein